RGCDLPTPFRLALVESIRFGSMPFNLRIYPLGSGLTGGFVPSEAAVYRPGQLQFISTTTYPRAPIFSPLDLHRAALRAQPKHLRPATSARMMEGDHGPARDCTGGGPSQTGPGFHFLYEHLYSFLF